MTQPRLAMNSKIMVTTAFIFSKYKACRDMAPSTQVTHLHFLRLDLTQRNTPTDTTLTTSRMVAMATGRAMVSTW